MAAVRKVEVPISSYGGHNFICLFLLTKSLLLQWVQLSHTGGVSKCDATEENK